MKINFKLAAAIFCCGNTVLPRQLLFAVANFEGCKWANADLMASKCANAHLITAKWANADLK